MQRIHCMKQCNNVLPTKLQMSRKSDEHHVHVRASRGTPFPIHTHNDKYPHREESAWKAQIVDLIRAMSNKIRRKMQQHHQQQLCLMLLLLFTFARAPLTASHWRGNWFS